MGAMLRLVKRVRYRVRLLYREPTYELAAGRVREPYSATYLVDANSSDEAREVALLRFRQVERLSSVSWVREVVGCEIALAAG